MLGLLDRLRSLIRQRTLLVTAALALVVAAVACSDTTSGGVVPTTGILIRAETLTSGKGCGAGLTQVFKYVVVVFRYTGGDPQARGSYTTFQAENLFDCYVDGEFVSLPNNVGNSIYRLEVYAFNQASYRSNQAAIDAAIKSTNDTDPANDQATSDPFKNALPTWTTECTATQSDEVETLAQCDPLTPGLGGVGDGTTKPTQISLATESFRLPDGRLAVCTPGATAADAGASEAGADASASDAGADASASDAGADASADAATDAGGGTTPPAVAFTGVRVRTRIGGTIVKDSVDLACPTVFSADVAADPTSYTLDVGLVDGAGRPVGQTACVVTTTTGAVNVATCP